MTEVRVGDVRENKIGGIYAIARRESSKFFSIVYTHGGVAIECDIKDIENEELLAHYDTFIEAVKSKEFNNAG